MASGRLVQGHDRRYRIDSVTSRPAAVIADAGEVGRVLGLLDKAEEACLIGRSVSAEVTLEPVVEVMERGTAAR